MKKDSEYFTAYDTIDKLIFAKALLFTCLATRITYRSKHGRHINDLFPSIYNTASFPENYLKVYNILLEAKSSWRTGNFFMLEKDLYEYTRELDLLFKEEFYK